MTRRIFPGWAGLLAALLILCPAFRETPASPPPPDAETAIGGMITGEVRLSGRLRVTDDILIPAGSTLVLAPGAVLTFDRSESSKVDPEYFFGGPEIVVRGRLRAAGAQFRFPDRTGGIVVDGGDARLTDCKVSGAEAGISVLRNGRVAAEGSLGVADCRVGVAFFPGHLPAWEGDGKVTLRKNTVGIVRFPGAPPVPDSFRPAESEEAEIIEWGGSIRAMRPEDGIASPEPSPGAKRLGDTFVAADHTLSGDVILSGIVRVAPGATLTIEPGSRLFFTFRDTNGDGIGENGIFLQGNLAARGTEAKPIGFYPFPSGGRGRWDSVNFMVSETGENILEHVVIVGAYRGLHAHFSVLKGKKIRIANCFRGIQFQESEVDLASVEIVSATSAFRCRDSNVRLSGFRTIDTASGSNFLRSVVRLDGADIVRPGWYGIRFREARVEAMEGEVREGLVGLSAQEGTVRADRFTAESAGLAGFAWQEGDVTMLYCHVLGSLLDGISATGGKVAMTGGALSGFGRYAVKLGGPADVVLRGVSLDRGKKRGVDPIFDGRVAPGLGIVKVE